MRAKLGRGTMLHPVCYKVEHDIEAVITPARRACVSFVQRGFRFTPQWGGPLSICFLPHVDPNGVGVRQWKYITSGVSSN